MVAGTEATRERDIPIQEPHFSCTGATWSLYGSNMGAVHDPTQELYSDQTGAVW